MTRLWFGGFVFLLALTSSASCFLAFANVRRPPHMSHQPDHAPCAMALEPDGYVPVCSVPTVVGCQHGRQDACNVHQVNDVSGPVMDMVVQLGARLVSGARVGHGACGRDAEGTVGATQRMHAR